MFLAAFSTQVCKKPRSIDAGFGQDLLDDFRIFDSEFAPPEAFVDQVMITAKVSLVFRVEHANVGDRRIENMLRSANGESAPGRLASAVHIAVLYAPPLMRIAILLQYTAGFINFSRAKITGN